MARPTRSELARQIRGHLELLQAGGLSHVRFKRKSGPAARKTPAAAAPAPPAPRGPAGPAKAPAPAARGVMAASVALEELKRFGGERAGLLSPLAEAVRVCEACRLCATRKQTVFGTGNPDSRLMIIGEAPGADEDQQGRPFVGRAGALRVSWGRAAQGRASSVDGQRAHQPDFPQSVLRETQTCGGFFNP